MKRELLKHKFAYAVLLLGLGIFVVSFLAAWPDRLLQRFIILSVAIFYFLWGVTTHLKAEHISRAIILEYAGMSTLVTVLLLLITL
jgi:hypothetical protein